MSPTQTISQAARSFSTDPRRRPRRTVAELAVLARREAALADLVRSRLDAAGEELALLARVGSDLSLLRFEGETPVFTHVGFAVRSGGEWSVDHLLNTHGGPAGHLYRQPLIDFFRDDPHDHRIAILAPSRDLQRRARAVLAGPVRTALHTPRYSRIAYPFATRYLNSNQWVAEILAAARSGAATREAAQAHLAATGLRPSVLRGIGPVKQALSGVVSRNTHLDDHPARNRLRGRLEFLLEVSLRAWVQRVDDVRSFETVAPGPDAQDSSRAPIA